MKKTPRQSKQNNSRILIGVVIGVAALAIVGFKIASSQAAAVPLTPEPDGAAAVAPAPAPTQQAATAYGPAAPQPTAVGAVASDEQDPFPSAPADQMAWASRHNKPAMILFHSTNCIPCKAMEALVQTVRADYEPDIVFVDVITNDRANLTLVRQAAIQAIPTTFFVSRAGQSARVVGAMKEDALRAKLDDMRKEP